MEPPLATATSLAGAAASSTGVTSVGDAPPDMPSGCSMSVVQGGDDDDTTGSQTLNWTSGTLHCSHAGLTAIPPLPANAVYLYVCACRQRRVEIPDP